MWRQPTIGEIAYLVWSDNIPEVLSGTDTLFLSSSLVKDSNKEYLAISTKTGEVTAVHNDDIVAIPLVYIAKENYPLQWHLIDGCHTVLKAQEEISKYIAHFAFKKETQIVTQGFYFDDNGEIIDISKLPEEMTALFSFEQYPFVSISNANGMVIGEYSYYIDYFEVKLIQAGFKATVYEQQKGDLFYTKSIPHVRVDGFEYCQYEKNEELFDCLEYTSFISRTPFNRGQIQIAYLYDKRTGYGVDYESKIPLDSELGKSLLHRAGVEL